MKVVVSVEELRRLGWLDEDYIKFRRPKCGDYFTSAMPCPLNKHKKGKKSHE